MSLTILFQLTFTFIYSTSNKIFLILTKYANLKQTLKSCLNWFFSFLNLKMGESTRSMVRGLWVLSRVFDQSVCRSIQTIDYNRGNQKPKLAWTCNVLKFQIFIYGKSPFTLAHSFSSTFVPSCTHDIKLLLFIFILFIIILK